MENPAFISFLRLLQSLITGFGIVILLLHLIRTSNLRTIAFKEAFVLTAVQVVRIAGILIFAGNGILLIKKSEAMGGWNNAYILSELMPAILCLVITQCLWIKKLYHKKAALVTLSLLLLVLPSKWLLAYLQGNEKVLPNAATAQTIVIAAALGAVVFFFLTFMIMNLTGRLKKLQ